MHDGASAGPHFNGLHPLVFRQVRRNLEELVVDGAARRDGIVLLHRENRVGLAHLPSLGERRQLRQIRGIPFRCARVGPLQQRVAIGGLQASVVQELTVRGVRVPGRHRAVGDAGRDGLGPRARVLVSDERHRADFPGPMAIRAVLVQDGSDVLAERRSLRGSRRRRKGPKEARQGHGSDRAIHTLLCGKPGLGNHKNGTTF